jgi:hypothetical protein
MNLSNNDITILLLCIIGYIIYKTNYKYTHTIEQFDEQTPNNNISTISPSCKDDCKCVNYDKDDPSLAFCGYKDDVLGLVACTDCDDSYYQEKCKTCIPAKAPVASDTKNILKYDDKLLYTEYSTNALNNEEIVKLNKQQDAHKQMYETNNNNKLYNLSINTIATNMSNTFVDIINDLFEYTQKYNKYEVNKIIYIFTKNDRSIYIGIIFVIFSLSLYFIDTTN